MKKISFFVALAFLALTGCEQDQLAPAGTDEQALEFQAKDFMFKWMGEALMVYPPNGEFTCEDLGLDYYEADYQGQLRGTFIGNADIFADGCFSYTEEVNQGRVKVTATKGSITFTYYTEYQPQDQTEEGVYPYAGTIEIIAGEGRFAGATGSGTLSVVQDTNLEGNPIDYSIEGTLNF